MFRFKKFSFKEIVKLFTNHLYIILLIPLIFIVYPLLGPGVVLSGDFPVTDTLYSHKLLSTWIEYGSHHNFESLPRYPIIILGDILNGINIGSDNISKLLVILGFFTASFSFYFSYMLFFKDKLKDHVTLFRIAAIIGSLFYAYNVWSFHRIGHWYLWLGYDILPLFIVSIIYAFKNQNKWKYVFVSVLTWSLASSTPHMVVFYGLFYLSFSVFFILRNISNKQALIKVGMPILSIIFLYLLINLYWIYPYTLYILYGGEKTFTPSTLVTEEMTAILSSDSSFLNVLRLIEDWWQPRIINVSPSETSLLYPFWLFASFVFPAVAFLSLLLKKNSKLVLLFSTIGIVGIILTLGTNGPFNFYSIFLFEAPLFSTLRFLFRDPDKWAFMIALAYSFLLSISSFEILKKVNKLKYKNIIASCFLILIFVSFLLYSYPTYNSTTQKVLDPVNLPTEYDRLNQYLRTSNTEKVFFMFQDYGPTVWSKGREFCCLDQRSSAKPNMMTYLPASQNYHDYLNNSILSNKSNNINNFIFPLGTSYVIYSNDELNPNNTRSRGLSFLQEFKNINNIGFFKIFKAGENNNVEELHIPKQNIILIGGLDLFSSLNSLPSFSSIDTSVSFLDQNLNKEQQNQSVNSADYLALAKINDDLTLSFLDEKYITTPFDATNREDPSKVWSKSVIAGENPDFHPYLKNLGIANWDFDYGKGLVITKAMGTKLSVPVEIENQNNDGKDNNFYLFMRYLRNQEGGPIKIYLDGNLINEVDTFDKISNNFVWEKLGSINLTKGKHTLTLENVAGFNAVNVFAFIPPDEMNRLRADTAHLLADKIRVIYLLEAESNFYNNKGIDSGTFHHLFDYDSNVIVDGNNNSTFTKTFRGQFKVPTNTDLVALEFLAKKNPNAESSYSIKDLEITPAYKKYNVFTSDFEKEKVSVSQATLRQFDWINYQKDLLSTSLETNRPIYGNNSLKVDVEQSNFSYWGTISTDFIPINENSYYNYSLEVSAKDVNQLHSKVYYYDSNKKEIPIENFIFGGTDGTFKEKFSNSFPTTNGAKYIKLQMWVSPNPKMHSSYLLDNVKLEEIKQFDWINYQKDLLSTSLETNRPIYGNNSLRVDLKQGNKVGWNILSTNFIPINDDAYYNATLDISAKDVRQLHSRILYFDLNEKAVMEEPDFIFGGKDGTFQDTFTSSILPPKGAKYVKYQILTKPDNPKASSYLLDNVKLEEIIPPNRLKNSFMDNLDMDKNLMTIKKEDSLKKQLKKDNSTNYVIETKPFPVKENHIYNYTVPAEAKNVSSYTAIALFKSSGDVVENSTRYGNNASNGRVLSLSPSSEIHTILDIIKPSNYTIALRAKTCETCTFLRVSIERDDDNKNINNSMQTTNISLKDKDAGLKWLYSNSTYLAKGTYELRIYSDSQTDLDSFVIYPTGNENASGNTNKKHSETLEDLFSVGENSSSPAQISEYKKINPTKYILNIKNATRPFMISFAEAYDPLWSAYTDTSHNNNNSDENNNFKTYGVPLYSVVNGFYINKTGDYTLTIEYEPQQWFVEGGIVSIVTLFLFTSIIIMMRYKKRLFFILKINHLHDVS